MGWTRNRKLSFVHWGWSAEESFKSVVFYLMGPRSQSHVGEGGGHGGERRERTNQQVEGPPPSEGGWLPVFLKCSRLLPGITNYGTDPSSKGGVAGGGGGDASRHAPHLRNSWKTLEDVWKMCTPPKDYLEDVNLIYKNQKFYLF